MAAHKVKGKADLVRFGDTLSLVMLLDKMRSFNGQRLLSKLPDNYIEKLRLNIPDHLLKLLSDVITVLMRRINVPEDEISTVTDQLYERRLQEMFTLLEEYDVQATRRDAKIEAVVNIIKSFHVTLTAAMDVIKLDSVYRCEVIAELQKQNIAFVE